MVQKINLIEKNIKDLEYNKTLNLITTYAVILATIILTVSLSELLTTLIKIIIIIPVFTIILYQIISLKRDLDNILKDVKSMG